MGSFFYEMEDIKFVGSITYDGSEQRILPYTFEISELPKDKQIAYYMQGEPEEEKYAVYGAKVL